MTDRSESEQQGGPLLRTRLFTGSEALFWMILDTERRLAAKLGNEEHLKAWRQTEVFDAARQEWWGGWARFALGHGLAPALNFHADLVGSRLKLEGMKDLLLALLRQLDEPPEETLRGMAEVLYVADRQGDVEFFKKISLARRSRGRRKAKVFFLASYILGYWFSGWLWLMSHKAGWAALCAYTGEEITKDAYRMECYRLGLKGHKDRMRRPPRRVRK